MSSQTQLKGPLDRDKLVSSFHVVMETVPGVMILKVLPTEVRTKPKFVRLKCLAVRRPL